MNPIDLSVSGKVQGGSGPTTGPEAKSAKAAKDFEAMLLRNMLSCLERTSHGAKRGPLSTGGEIHTSMMVSALADAMAAAGGIGLGKQILGDKSVGGHPAINEGTDRMKIGAKGSEHTAVVMDGSSTRSSG
jgi:Rod binding domain-containing protein